MQTDVEVEGELDPEDYWRSESDVPAKLRWIVGEADKVSSKYPDVQIDGTKLESEVITT